VSATISGIEYTSDSANEIITKKNDVADNFISNYLSIKEKSKQVAKNVIDTTEKEYIKKLNITWWGFLTGIIIIQLIYFGTMIYRADKKSRRNRTNKSGLYTRRTKTIKHYHI
jgi:hypothetical protein